MTAPTNARLAFLARVVGKEIEHLRYAQAQVFDPDFTPQDAASMDDRPDFALKVEAFASRFKRLQDAVGDRLPPAWLDALGEPIGPAIDNLNKAERLGVLSSVNEWLTVRGLRNQMVHEYIESPEILADALNQANAHGDMIIDCASAILADCKRRSLI